MTIKKDSVVDVHFVTSRSIFRAKVLFTPGQENEPYVLELEDGRSCDVLLFEQMVESEPEVEVDF